MPSDRKFRASALERDFEVLFGRDARWVWPFYEGDLIGSLFNLGCTTFFVGIAINIFVDVEFKEAGFIGLAAFVFLWELLRLNYKFIAQRSLRKKLQRRYFPLIEHTEAFELLMDSMRGRRKGVVHGASSREESNELMLRLWKVCFAEAELLDAPLGSGSLRANLVDHRPDAKLITSYLEDRERARIELDT